MIFEAKERDDGGFSVLVDGEVILYVNEIEGVVEINPNDERNLEAGIFLFMFLLEKAIKYV